MSFFNLSSGKSLLASFHESQKDNAKMTGGGRGEDKDSLRLFTAGSNKNEEEEQQQDEDEEIFSKMDLPLANQIEDRRERGARETGQEEGRGTVISNQKASPSQGGGEKKKKNRSPKVIRAYNSIEGDKPVWKPVIYSEKPIRLLPGYSPPPVDPELARQQSLAMEEENSRKTNYEKYLELKTHQQKLTGGGVSLASQSSLPMTMMTGTITNTPLQQGPFYPPLNRNINYPSYPDAYPSPSPSSLSPSPLLPYPSSSSQTYDVQATYPPPTSLPLPPPSKEEQVELQHPQASVGPNGGYAPSYTQQGGGEQGGFPSHLPPLQYPLSSSSSPHVADQQQFYPSHPSYPLLTASLHASAPPTEGFSPSSPSPLQDAHPSTANMDPSLVASQTSTYPSFFSLSSYVPQPSPYSSLTKPIQIPPYHPGLNYASGVNVHYNYYSAEEFSKKLTAQQKKQNLTTKDNTTSMRHLQATGEESKKEGHEEEGEEEEEEVLKPLFTSQYKIATGQTYVN